MSGSTYSPNSPRQGRRTSNAMDEMNFYLTGPFGIAAPTDQVFTGAPGQDFRKWLRRWATHHARKPDGIARDAGDWIEELWSCIEGDAAKRVKRDHATKAILDSDLTEATEDTKRQFQTLLTDLFPEQDDQPDDSPGTEIMSTKQESNQSIWEYYQAILLKVKMAGSSDVTSQQQSVAAKAILDMAIKAFVVGLRDHRVVIRLTGYEFDPTRSLRGAFAKAEAEERRIKMETEYSNKLKAEQEAQLHKQMAELMLMGQKVPDHLIQQARVFSDPVESSDHRHRDLQLLLPSPPQVPVQYYERHPVSREEPRQLTQYRPQPPQPTQFPQIQKPPHPSTPQSPGPMASGALPPLTNQDPRQRRQQFDLSGFDPSTSQNPYVNGQTPYAYVRGNPLCSRCGLREGHMAIECDRYPLPRPEQEYLKNMIRQNIEQWKASQPQRSDSQATGANAVPLGSRLVEVGHTQHDMSDYLSADDASWSDLESIGVPDTQIYQLAIGSTHMDAEAFVNEDGQPPSKRPRPDAGEEDVVDTPLTDGTRKKKTAKGKGVARKPRELTKITGMLLEKPSDVQGTLKGTSVVLPFLELAQLSPFFRAEVKRLLGVPRKPRKKKAAAAAKEPEGEGVIPDPPPQVISHVTSMSAEAKAPKISDEVSKGITAWKTKDRTSRAWALPITACKEGSDEKWHISRNETVADQGSDICLIYPNLREHLGLQLRPISQLLENKPSLRMTTADGGVHELRHWVTFMVEIQAIKREIWAFACPSNGQNISLLLGLPFLESVDAHFHIRRGIIEIGDSDLGEAVIAIKAPQITSLKPRLEVPGKPATRGKKKVTFDTQDQASSSDDSDDEEDEEDEEDSSSDDSGSSQDENETGSKKDF